MNWKNTSWHYKTFVIIWAFLVVLNLLIILTVPLWDDYFNVVSVFKFQRMFLIPITSFFLTVVFLEFLTLHISNLGKEVKKDDLNKYLGPSILICLIISSIILIIIDVLNLVEGYYFVLLMFFLFALSIVLGLFIGKILKKIKNKFS